MPKDAPRPKLSLADLSPDGVVVFDPAIYDPTALLDEGNGTCQYEHSGWGQHARSPDFGGGPMTCVCGCNSDEPSRVECTLIDGAAGVCRATNLFHYVDERKSPPSPVYAAFCTTSARRNPGDRGFWKHHEDYYNPVANGYFIVRSPLAGGRVPRVIEGGASGATTYDAATVDARVVQMTAEMRGADYAYINSGDCNWGKNPWHCSAGILNYHIVSGVLGLAAKTGVHVLIDGFRDFVPGAPMYPLWEGLFPGGLETRYIDMDRREKRVPAMRLALEGRVPLAVFAPNPWWSPAWKAPQFTRQAQGAGCSEAWSGAARSLGRRIDRQLAPRLDKKFRLTHPLEALVADRHVRVISGNRGALARLRRRAEAKRVPFREQVPVQRDLVVVIRRSPHGMRDFAKCGRCITNIDAVAKAVGVALPNATTLLVHATKQLDYWLQYYMWRSAGLVVATHGGALGHTLVMRPQQALFEIQAMSAGGRYLASFAGVPYDGIECPACEESRRKTGPVDVVELTRRVEKLARR